MITEKCCQKYQKKNPKNPVRSPKLNEELTVILKKAVFTP